MVNFYFYLYDEIDQYASTTATHLHIILQFLLTKGFIDPILTTMWDHTGGCAHQYLCESAIYLLSCISLEYCIILYRAFGAPEHGKDFVYGLFSRDKLMLKLETAKLLTPGLIQDYPIFLVHAGSLK